MKFLDLSGYMFSGKSAASDLIKEHSGFYVPHYRSEFDLIRIPRGLNDLKKAIIDDWSWVRSDKALRDFIELVEVLNRRPSSVLDKLFRPGFSYSERYDRFLQKSMHFVDKITEASWVMPWPYELISLNPLQNAKLKIISKLRKHQSWPEINYRLISGDDFFKHAKVYLREILINEQALEDSHTVVTHNMLEAYNPAEGFSFFDNIKSIIVDRDIRDIYMTATTYSKGFNDTVSLYSKIIGAFDIQIFIARQKILREKTNYQNQAGVLRINFENLVNNYDETCGQIRQFLGTSASDHINKMKYFNPEESRKNIGLWNNARGEQLNAIRRLELELPDLCRL
jgi:hypothetical protein